MSRDTVRHRTSPIAITSAPATLDPDLAVQDHEELLAGLTLAHDRLAGRERPLGARGQDRLHELR